MRGRLPWLVVLLVGCNAILGNEEKALAPDAEGASGAGEQGAGGSQAGNATVGGNGAVSGSSDAGGSGAVGGDTETMGGSNLGGDQAGGVPPVIGGTGDGGEPPIDPCEGAADGTSCGDGLSICLNSSCVISDCGDGYLDEAHLEECDDGNDQSGDGCESGCTRTCTPENDQCDDDDPCNGVESCSESFMCVATSPLDCDDEIPCTADSCDAGLGCLHDLIDGDGDDYASTSLGACGTDCDDTNPAINEDAGDACDGIDNDCDGAKDEDGVATWWQDCDGDGYAALAAPTRTSCAKPAEATSCAGGDWVTINPATNDDCNDANDAIRPGATELVGDQVDQDCDDKEQCYRDNDNDGYRTTTVMTSLDTDCADSTEARNNEPSGNCGASDPFCDCNDNNPAIKPGATELVGDQVDQNCDTDESCYRDNDNDGSRTTTVINSGDIDCTDSGEARNNEPSGNCSGTAGNPICDCNDGNASIYPNKAEVCNFISDDCDAQIDEGLSPTADADESNSTWESVDAGQPGSPSLPPVPTGDSLVVSPGASTFHTETDADHYVWKRAYASWNPFYQPRWMCRITGLRQGQTVSMAVGVWRPGGPFDVTDCGTGSSGMACFSHTAPCPFVQEGGVCQTGEITNPSAGPDAYGFGVYLYPVAGFDTCDNSYKVECKLRDDDEWE
jgi:hypothetical protein